MPRRFEPREPGPPAPIPDTIFVHCASCGAADVFELDIRVMPPVRLDGGDPAICPKCGKAPFIEVTGEEAEQIHRKIQAVDEFDNFQDWMNFLDHVIFEMFGFTSQDLADWDYRGAFDKGMKPQDAAMKAIHADGILLNRN